MRISEIIDQDQDVEEAKPSKSYCKSTPSDEMSASWRASCKSRGIIGRDSKVKAKYGKDNSRKKIKGKVKGRPYGGPLPNYS